VWWSCWITCLHISQVEIVHGVGQQHVLQLPHIALLPVVCLRPVCSPHILFYPAAPLSPLAKSAGDKRTEDIRNLSVSAHITPAALPPFSPEAVRSKRTEDIERYLRTAMSRLKGEDRELCSGAAQGTYKADSVSECGSLLVEEQHGTVAGCSIGRCHTL